MHPELNPNRMDIFNFANFPFVGGASKYVERLDFKFDELFSDRAFEQVRERGKERVLEAIGNGIIKKEYSDRIAAEKELLSYPIARILVSCIKDIYLIKRYALSEAKSVFSKINYLDENDLKEIIVDFTIDATLYEKYAIVHFADFLRYTSGLNDPRWKLVNRNICNGKVYVTREDLARIIEEAARKRIESGLPLSVPSSLCLSLERYHEEIRRALETRKSEFNIQNFKEILPECFPPCIIHAISNIKANMNLPHSMRFALVSFLINIGLSNDGIIELFKESPDFDEEKTRYQINHIHGSTGMQYTPPACATMITYGNCLGKEALCERVSHPLSYYRKKLWIMKKGESS